MAFPIGKVPLPAQRPFSSRSFLLTLLLLFSFAVIQIASLLFLLLLVSISLLLYFNPAYFLCSITFSPAILAIPDLFVGTPSYWKEPPITARATLHIDTSSDQALYYLYL